MNTRENSTMYTETRINMRLKKQLDTNLLQEEAVKEMSG